MDLSDIQGLVFHPYRDLPYAAYNLLRFRRNNQRAAQRWLSDLITSESIDSATPKEAGPGSRAGVRLNIAFTVSGLTTFGLREDAVSTFPLAFIDGLGARWNGGPDHRSRALGDLEASAPHNWKWGYQGNGGVDEQGPRHRDDRFDALLLVFAATRWDLLTESERWIIDAERSEAIDPGSSLALFGEFEGDREGPVREPFGFADGVSQPVLKGARGKLRQRDRSPQPRIHELEDGEILLGHVDEAQKVSRSPTVAAVDDPRKVLPGVHDDPDRRDIGHNGTYLVFRQLAQDVAGFNGACESASRRAGIPEDRFKAFLVGRWQDGSPLITCPIAHDPARRSAPAANDFGYREDPHGERCPIGAHIRRANPRDSLGDDPDQSWRVSNRHRILRRGRPYRNGHERGLHFICLNADIERQFEFIQQNWINDGTFGGLDGEDDPLIGQRLGHAAVGCVTLPPPADTRVPRRVAGLARFVTVKGGGYFFLPSLTALRYLAGLPAVHPQAQAALEPVPLSKGEWVRFLVLARVPILLGVVLAAAPLMLVGENSQLATIARPMFLLSDPMALFLVTVQASLAAAIATVTWRIVQLHAAARFNAAAPLSIALTWRHVLGWQSLSLPIVGTALYLSVSDAMVIREHRWDVASEHLWFGFATFAGYVAAFGVLLMAARAHTWSLQPSDRGEALFLPAYSKLTKVSRTPLWIRPFMLLSWITKRIIVPFVRFVEGTIATWPPDRGAGYIDHEKKTILPGHLAALALALTMAVFYLAGGWLFRPSTLPLGFQLPPMAYLLFLLMMTGWVAAGAAFFLDRFRVPLLTALVAWLLIVGTIGGTDHEFPVVKAESDLPLPDGPSIAASIAKADAYNHNVQSVKPPIILVAAGGGGVHQAAWTAQVLTGSTHLWGSAFTKNLRLISGVSAGSVGAMHFLSRFKENRTLTESDLKSVTDAAQASSTGDIWWGLAYPDLTRSLLPLRPIRLFPSTLDRAWALEQSWRRAMKPTCDSPAPKSDPDAAKFKPYCPTMGQWQAGVADGWLPAVAFNAMVVETGERAVLATYKLPGAAPPRNPEAASANNPESAAKDIGSITGKKDLSVITAARLSATFPYITPVARPNNSTGTPARMGHLVDGGYWDNHAVVTVLDWLMAAKEQLKGRQVLVLSIPPPPEPGGGAADRAWSWQMVAPLQAIVSMRTDAQKARNRFEIDQVKAGFEQPGQDRQNPQITWVELPFTGADTMLSWHLSKREQRSIEEEWRTKYATDGKVADMNKITELLNCHPRSWVNPVLQECAP
jgi:Dyp-type peroxidase family